MDNQRPGIIKEVVIVTLLVASLLATGGWLVANVVTAVRNMDGVQVESGSAFDDIEKALKEIADKLLSAAKKTPAAPPPPPAAVAPGEAKPAAPAVGKKTEVNGVKFFEAGQNSAPANQRAYKTSFSRPRHIFTEISYKNPNYKVAEVDIPVIIQYYDPAGQMTGEIKRAARPKKEWASAIFSSGWGPAAPASWQPGRHTVKVYMDGDFIGDFPFTVE